MRRHGDLISLAILLSAVCWTSCWTSSDASSGNAAAVPVPHLPQMSDSALGTIMFMASTFLIGALTRHLISKIFPTFPYTVALLAIGMLIGFLFRAYESDLQSYVGLLHIDPHLLMYAFLPVLLFESAFLLDIHAIKKCIGQILILAIPGYLLTSAMTAAVCMFIFSYNWSWNASMMVGAILSATDPVAVVALLKNSPGGKDVHHLSIVIEGESLLNDGAAIVLFNIFQNNAMEPCPGQTYYCPINGTMTEFTADNFCSNYMDCDSVIEINKKMCTSMTAQEILTSIVLKAIGGPLIGIVLGYIFVYWLGKVFNDYLTEITITVGSPYLVYYVSEMFLQASGVLSVVVFGAVVNMNKMNISPEIEQFLNKFWEQMGYLVNTIIFLVVGMIITFSAMDNIEPEDIVYLVALYLGVAVSRSFMLCFFHFILTKLGYGTTWQSASVLMWGALRGAVSLALAIEVNHNTGFCEAMRSKILFFVSGIVVMTLLINSTTFNQVLSLLGFCHISKAKKVAVDSAANQIMEAMTNQLVMLRRNEGHTDSDWDEVKKICHIDTIYKAAKEQGESRDEIEKLHAQVTACENCSSHVPVPLTTAELTEFYDESRNRVLKAFKISLWKQFDSGLLAKPALRFLDDICDQTFDTKDKFIELEDIEFTWKIGNFLKYSKAKLEAWQNGRKQEEYPIPNNINQYNVYRLVSSNAFEIIIMCLIFINVTIVCMELSISKDKCESVNGVLRETALNKSFKIVNYTFLFVFIVEMILKLIGQRKYYFYHKWNLVDFVIILISIADSLSEVFTNCGTDINVNFNVFRIIRIVRLFRCVRLIKWVFLFLHNLIRDLSHKSVSSGYDIGVGFIVASDEVLANIEQIVAYKECRDVFRKKIVKAREEVNASLGQVRKEFSGISIAINTKQVTRLILNKGREYAWKLLDDGMVDDFDAALFTKQLEEKMKRLLASPVFWMPPPDTFTLFSQVPWLKSLKDFIIYNVVKYATHQMYNEGEIFLKKGEIAAGVYVVISGRARVTQTLEKAEKKEISRSFSLNLACQHKNNDCLGPGSIVGEQSILVNRPRGSFVVCETDLQCYFIAAEDMHGLMLKYPIIEENLWRVCSIRMAQSLLARNKRYKTKHFEDLKAICERSVQATLVPETNNGLFEVDDAITDIIVIYGETKCFPSNTHIVGPKMIPEGTTKLSLITPCKMLLLIHEQMHIDLEQYNEVPDEAARSLMDATSKRSLLKPGKSNASIAFSDAADLDNRDPFEQISVRLSTIVTADPNPNTRQQYEKRRRLSHLKDHKAADGNQPIEGTGTVNHGEGTCPHREMTPVEDPDKKLD